MDHLQAVSVFVAVAEREGFSAAARQLNISPSSVTRAIAQLEDRLGVRLFTRSTQVVRLTDSGRRYLADCQRLLAEWEEAERSVAGVHRSPRGTVSVTAPLLCGRMIVAPILLELLDRYPGIALTALFVDRVVHLADEGIDIAVRFGELSDSSHVALRVGETRRILCASPAYLAAHGRPRTPADLDGHAVVDLVSMKHNGQWRFRRSGKTLSYKPKSRLQVNSADVAVAAALDGYGIARIAAYQASSQLRDGTLEVLLEPFEPPPVPLHLIRKEPGPPSGRVRAAFDHLAARLRTAPGLRW